MPHNLWDKGGFILSFVCFWAILPRPIKKKKIMFYDITFYVRFYVKINVNKNYFCFLDYQFIFHQLEIQKTLCNFFWGKFDISYPGL